MILKTLSRICFLFFLFILVNYVYIGLTTIPTEGDSLNYHIPIAKAYLEGNIFNPEKINGTPFLKYSPGATESILAVFYLFHIPPNLFNVLGIVVFFLSIYFLSKKIGFGKSYGIILASSISTLTGMVRWLDTQKIDIFLATFFTLSLALLIKPQKTKKYFFILGAVLGMLVGSKYSGLFFGIILLIVFSKKVLNYISVGKLLAFVIPFSILGLSWYLRNYLVAKNPLYPQGFLFFEDHGFKILSLQVWKVATASWFGFFGTVNAFISEYMVWILTVPIFAFFIFKNIKKIQSVDYRILSLFTIGILNGIVYLFLPSDNKDFIMVSVIRYSYPFFIPFMVGVFWLAKKYHLEDKIGIVAIVNMFFVGFPLAYNPKLVFFAIPIALLYFFVEHYRK